VIPWRMNPAAHQVFLRELWPGDDSVEDAVRPGRYAGRVHCRGGTSELVEEYWGRVAAAEGELFAWDAASTYIIEPAVLLRCSKQVLQLHRHTIAGARVLGIFGDNYTTDHASPGGRNSADSPAGELLQSLGVAPREFNSYGGAPR